MATPYETLLVSSEGGITTITLNRPEKRNAMSPQLHNEMFELLTELRYDKETRVVVVGTVALITLSLCLVAQFGLRKRPPVPRSRRYRACERQDFKVAAVILICVFLHENQGRSSTKTETSCCRR